MRARHVIFIITALSVTACSHVPWTGKYMAGPMKRGHASEERAVQAIDEYFIAAKDLIGLSQTGIHDDCLNAYWEEGPMTSLRRKRMSSDKVCSILLDRYDKAAVDLAGYGQAPSGKYPWLGEVFEYVVRAETAKSKEEKMSDIDRLVVGKFSDLLLEHDSPLIARFAEDYYVIRGTCCRDVTVYDDWYKSRFKTKAAK